MPVPPEHLVMAALGRARCAEEVAEGGLGQISFAVDDQWELLLG